MRCMQVSEDEIYLSRMNETEKKAYLWLKGKYKEIIFNRRSSPNFDTEDGSFQVKLLYGNSIIFTQAQFKKVKEKNAKVLVYRADGNEPFMVIDPNNLNAGVYRGILIRVQKTQEERTDEIRIPCSVETWRAWRMFSTSYSSSEEALRSLLYEKGFLPFKKTF